MNTQTNFQDVVNFNEQFGVPMLEQPSPSIFNENPKLVKLRMDLIREEMKELEDAVKDHNLVETTDALADILYVVYGMGASFGINLDEAFKLVHESNMSKLCVSEEEAQRTVDWYEKEYAEGRLPYDSPSYRKSKNDKYWVVYNKSSGKVLKSINYNPVDLKPLLQL